MTATAVSNFTVRKEGPPRLRNLSGSSKESSSKEMRKASPPFDRRGVEVGYIEGEEGGETRREGFPLLPNLTGVE